MRIDNDSSVFINEYMSVLDDINEKKTTHLHTLKSNDSARDGSYMNSYNSKVDVALSNRQMVQCVVLIIMVSMLYVNFIHLYYLPPIGIMYFQEQNLNQ